MTVEGTAGGGVVTVVVNGHQDVQEIKIQPEAVDPEDVEMLEDLILAAVNDGLRKSRELSASEIEKVTGKLNIPGMPQDSCNMYRRYPKPLARLIEELVRLPGIGPKPLSAWRSSDQPIPGEVESLATSIVEAKRRIHYCSQCFHLTEEDTCAICSDPKRNQKFICVVEEPRDVIAMERTKSFDGVYHVLHGAISPLDGIGPNQLKVKELLARISPEVDEVVLATDPNVEGEATAMYLARLLKPLGVKVTRMAHGMPVGGDLEYVDEVTLSKALEGRREL